jgi:DNA-binding MarR family transcriptional regulator
MLTVTHTKLLVAIANGKNTELTSKEFLSESKLASSSVVRGLDDLLGEDFIEKVGNKYERVDPLLKTVLLMKA